MKKQIKTIKIKKQIKTDKKVKTGPGFSPGP